MADDNKDGYDDVTGQENPVVNPRVVNTVPRGTFNASPETVRENKNANRYASTNRYSSETLRENYNPLMRSAATAPVDRGVNRPSFTGPSVYTPARASITSPVKPVTTPTIAPQSTGRGN